MVSMVWHSAVIVAVLVGVAAAFRFQLQACSHLNKDDNAPTAPVFPPALAADFEGATLLGKGTAGVVWEAQWVVKGGDAVAVKVERSDNLASAREWRQECENAELLQQKCTTEEEAALFTKCFFPLGADALPTNPVYMVTELAGEVDLQTLFFYPMSMAPTLLARRHLLKQVLQAVIVMLRGPNPVGTGDLHFGNIMAIRNAGSSQTCPYDAKLIDFENSERGISSSERQRAAMLDNALQLWLVSELYNGVDDSTMGRWRKDVSIFEPLKLFAAYLPCMVELTKSDLQAGRQDFSPKAELLGLDGGLFLRNAVAQMLEEESYNKHIDGFFEAAGSQVPESMREPLLLAHKAVSGQWAELRKKLQVPKDAHDVTFPIAEGLLRLRADFGSAAAIQKMSEALDIIPDC